MGWEGGLWVVFFFSFKKQKLHSSHFMWRKIKATPKANSLEVMMKKRTLNIACGKIYTLASNYIDKYSPIYLLKKIKGATSIIGRRVRCEGFFFSLSLLNKPSAQMRYSPPPTVRLAAAVGHWSTLNLHLIYSVLAASH